MRSHRMASVSYIETRPHASQKNCLPRNHQRSNSGKCQNSEKYRYQSGRCSTSPTYPRPPGRVQSLARTLEQSQTRVQSVAVKMIVEKEREIQAFVPQESWKISAPLSYEKQKILVSLHKEAGKVKHFKNQAEVETFFKIFGTENISEKK